MSRSAPVAFSPAAAACPPQPRARTSQSWRQQSAAAQPNVGGVERTVSAAAGLALAAWGLSRRDFPGLGVAGLGGALAYRGISGHCPVYERLHIDHATTDGEGRRQGVHVSHALLINKSPEEVYAFWRAFENLPRFMSHLQSVESLGGNRTRWVTTAPALYGGQVEWEAELVADDPGARLAWRTAPGSDVEHTGSVRFVRALGDRGTNVSVDLDYRSPAGVVGRWIAKLFGEEPEQQIRDDLRRLKRVMEIGEVITTEGQPRGTCAQREASQDGRRGH